MGVARAYCAYDKVSLLRILQRLRGDFGTQTTRLHGVHYAILSETLKGRERILGLGRHVAWTSGALRGAILGLPHGEVAVWVHRDHVRSLLTGRIAVVH